MIPNYTLYAKPSRWLKFPNGDQRLLAERWETEHLRTSTPVTRSRKYTADAANAFFLKCDSAEREPVVREAVPESRQDVRWTAQFIGKGRTRADAREGEFDELLYRIYAKNLDVFGEKAERDLYFLDVGCSKIVEATYQIARPKLAPSGADRDGVLRLRSYVVLKEVDFVGARDLGRTWFSSIFMVAAVLSPLYKLSGDVSDVIDLSLMLEEATWGIKGQVASPQVRLDDFLFRNAVEQLQVVFPDVRRKPESHSVWTSFQRLPLTTFTAVILAADQQRLPRALLCDRHRAEAPASNWEQPWRTAFLHFLARVCVPHYHVTMKGFGFWLRRERLRWWRELKTLR